MSKIVMKIPGISGDVTQSSYAGWIELDYMEFQMAHDVRTSVGKSSNRSQGMLQFDEIVLQKMLDQATTNLLQAAIKRKVFSLVQISVCSDDNKWTPIVTYKLGNVIISQHQHIASQGGLPKELLQLNYTSIQMNYAGRNSDMSLGSPSSAGFDIAAASSM